MSGAIYAGSRFAGRVVVTVQRGKGCRFRPLARRLDLAWLSPYGFEWGYGGSGPAQLALALLADCLGDDGTALRLHQAFKWAFIAGISARHWRITEAEISTWVAGTAERADAG